MEIRKGPFGHFAVETTTERIYLYASEIINRSVSTSFLPVYISRNSDTVELAYDFSGMVQISSIQPTTDMRKSAADLFLSIIKCPDYLLPISKIHFDDDYIFYNRDSNSFHICVPPILPEENDSALSMIDGKKLETYLNNSLFARIFTQDEIDELCSCVLTNNEEKAENLLVKIKNTSVTTELKDSLIESKQLSVTCFLGLLALITIETNPLIAIISSFCGLALLLYYINRNKTDSIKMKDNINLQTIQERKDVLFNEEDNFTVDSPGYLILKSRQKIDGEYLRRAVYTDRTTLGSDCFLSDICIDDKSVSPIHLSIVVHDGRYYVVDRSSDNSSYVENRRITPGKEYEIKNGQVLRCGIFDFEVSIEH